MNQAHVLTIGTEITSGEIVNSNAAWISTRLEQLGLRVQAHITVRDQREEVLSAFAWLASSPVLIVTGGLGPTSDDLTRELVATYTQRPLEFDDHVWADLARLHGERQLPLREAHKHQCFFPKGSERLKNPVGSALGFYVQHGPQQIFVLPGPPRELEGMWIHEVEPRLKRQITTSDRRWVRWTCLGAPESEIAELVEPAIAGTALEVGYRAQVPYVRVKVFANPAGDAQLVNAIEQALAPYIVGRGDEDWAKDLFQLWPDQELSLWDELTGPLLLTRLHAAHASCPQVRFSAHAGTGLNPEGAARIELVAQDDETLKVRWRCARGQGECVKTLPYKIKLASERGRRSAVEWALWLIVSDLRARQP